MIQKAFDIGVTIRPGSDAGSDILPHGITFLEEINLLRQAGLPFDTILSATSAGHLTTGGKAAFLVLEGINTITGNISVIDRFPPPL